MALTEFHIKRGDTLPVLAAILTGADGQPINLTGAAVVLLMRRESDEPAILAEGCDILSAPAGSVQYPWAAGDTDEAGRFQAEFEVTFSGGAVFTFPNKGYLTIVIDPDIG